MNKAAISCIVMLALALPGCSEEKSPRSPVYTLYRNAPVDLTMRVHWATFDADEPGNYNLGNCQMASDLLNKNLREKMGDGTRLRFWCELGPYRP